MWGEQTLQQDVLVIDVSKCMIRDFYIQISSSFVMQYLHSNMSIF